MNCFWREEPLTETESKLLDALNRAHAKAVFRQNPSSVAIQLSAQGSGDLTKALAAALATLGGSHAPLVQTVELLSAKYPVRVAEDMLNRGKRVFGWGSSFPLPDPDWYDVECLLDKHYPEIWEKVASVTAVLHTRGVKILPNPSTFTAAVSLALALPPQLAPLLFVSARLDSWAEVFWRATK